MKRTGRSNISAARKRLFKDTKPSELPKPSEEPPTKKMKLRVDTSGKKTKKQDQQQKSPDREEDESPMFLLTPIKLIHKRSRCPQSRCSQFCVKKMRLDGKDKWMYPQKLDLLFEMEVEGKDELGKSNFYYDFLNEDSEFSDDDDQQEEEEEDDDDDDDLEKEEDEDEAKTK